MEIYIEIHDSMNFENCRPMTTFDANGWTMDEFWIPGFEATDLGCERFIDFLDPKTTCVSTVLGERTLLQTKIIYRPSPCSIDKSNSVK